MATIHVRFGSIMPTGAPVYPRAPRKSETVTSSGTSAMSANSAVGGEFITVTAIDGAVYALIGTNPTALATGAGMEAIPSGGTKDFGPVNDGDKIAVIDV